MKKPKNDILSLIFALALLSQQGYSQETFPIQSWKNKDGKIIEASLVSIPSEGDKLIIKLKTSGQKYTLNRSDLNQESIEQLHNMVEEVKGEWKDEKIIPTASLAYKAAALGLTQRQRKKVGEFQYLKVLSFNIKNNGQEALAFLEGNLAVEFIPTGNVRFVQSSNNLVVKASNNKNSAILATKGAVFPMELSGPLRWGTFGTADCPVFTKLIRVSDGGDYVSVDGERLRE